MHIKDVLVVWVKGIRHAESLEGFHSRFKADYRRHRGLSKEHKIGYLHWYCYLKNNGFSNTN